MLHAQTALLGSAPIPSHFWMEKQAEVGILAQDRTAG